MTIVLVGGGSGGHIMPLLAVARELRKRNHPNLRLVYIGDRGGNFSSIAMESGLFDESHTIYAGKIRRYHGESIVSKLLDVKTLLLNARDVAYVLIGTIQSILLLQKLQAKTALLKGGYVCVPVAIGARFHHIRTITHDSDAVPGLSNKLASRFATVHAVGMPVKNYNYPEESIKFVGVPINTKYTENLDSKKLADTYDIQHSHPVLLITGGSQGSRRINAAIIGILPDLIHKFPHLHIFHHVGTGNTDQYAGVDQKIIKKHATIFEFSDRLYEMSFASDLIITRAGATTLAEFAAQSKAMIIIPHPELAGDHQTKNAQIYEKEDAAIVLSEHTIELNQHELLETIQVILKDTPRRHKLEQNIHKLMPKKAAAEELADLILDISQEKV